MPPKIIPLSYQSSFLSDHGRVLRAGKRLATGAIIFSVATCPMFYSPLLKQIVPSGLTRPLNLLVYCSGPIVSLIFTAYVGAYCIRTGNVHARRQIYFALSISAVWIVLLIGLMLIVIAVERVFPAIGPRN